MAQKKGFLEPTMEKAFKSRLKVRLDDINHGNHLDVSRIVSFLANTRAILFKSLGIDEFDGNGNGIITASVDIKLKSQAQFDDSLLFIIRVARVKPVRFDLVYDIINETTGNQLASAVVCIAYINYNTGRPTKISDEMSKAIKEVA